MNTLRVMLSHSDREKQLILFSPKYVTVECRHGGRVNHIDIETDEFLDMVVKLPVVQRAINDD